MNNLGKNYWRLLISLSVSNLGDGMTLIALPWLATLAIKDPLTLSWISAVARIPWLLLSIPVGAWIDRNSPIQIMIWASLFRLLLLFGLFLAVGSFGVTSSVLIPVLIVATFGLGMGEVAFDSSTQVAIPLMIRPVKLGEGNANARVSEILSNDIAGKTLGGILLSINTLLPFASEILLICIATVVILPLRRIEQPKKILKRLGLFATMRAGLNEVYADSQLRGLLMIAACVTVPYAALLSTQVLLVQQSFGMSSSGYAALLSIAIIGSLVGARLAVLLSRKYGHVAMFQLALIGMAASYGCVMFAQSGWVLGVLYVVASVFVTLSSISGMTMRQHVIKPESLGVVSGVFRFASWGLSSLAMLAGGVVVSALSPVYGTSTALRIPYVIVTFSYMAILIFSRSFLTRLSKFNFGRSSVAV